MPLPQATTPTGQPTSGAETYFEYKLASNVTPTVATTLTAAAVAGATTLAVTALTGAIPAGSVIHFDSGVDATLTAAAASGATALTVLPLSGPLASAAPNNGYDGYTAVPVTGDVNIAFTPGSVEYEAYVSSGQSPWTFAVATGNKGTLTLHSAAPDNDPSLKPLVIAGLGKPGGRLAYFRMRRGSGTWYYGAWILGFNMSNGARAIAENMFDGPTTGPVLPYFPS